MRKTPRRAQARRPRILYNNDGSFLLSNDAHGNRELTVADARDYVDLMEGTPVTTYLICVNAAMPHYGSAVERHSGSLAGSKHVCAGEAGTGAPLKAREQVRLNAIDALAARGTDMVSLVLARCREKGLEGFTSMRMNDVHNNKRARFTPRYQPEFWLDHPEFDLGPGAPEGWNARNTHGFAHPAVRAYKLALLREMMEKFDPDGHELDFMRAPVFFPAGEGRDACPIMTGFLRQCREIVKAAAARSGRERLLGVRIPAALENCRSIGLDPRTWVGDGLVDFITLSVYDNESPVPVRRFRREIGNTAIPIYAAIDRCGVRGQRGIGGWGHGHLRAAAANRWREGADGIYFFNFFFTAGDEGVPVADDPVTPEQDLSGEGQSRALLRELADPAILKNRNKIYESGNGLRKTFNAALAFDLPAASRKKVLRFHLAMAEGKTRPRAARLFLRCPADTADLAVRFNGADCAPSGADGARYGLNANMSADHRICAYEVPVTAIRNGDNMVVLKNAAGDFRVERADCAAIHGPVESHGYF